MVVVSAQRNSRELGISQEPNYQQGQMTRFKSSWVMSQLIVIRKRDELTLKKKGSEEQSTISFQTLWLFPPCLLLETQCT